jgi:tetratricopeptide (TPR) repeat protein
MSGNEVYGDEPQEVAGAMRRRELAVSVCAQGWKGLRRVAVVVMAVLAALGAATHNWRGRAVIGAMDAPAPITIDYPLNRSIFPPDMAAPTFEWRDAAESATKWQIDIAFADGAPALHVKAQGEAMKIGEIDVRCISSNNKLPTLTAEQAAAHTWKPDAATWAALRAHGVEHAATIAISGFAGDASQPLSRGSMQLTISRDPVGAPIFYRDVPLMPSATEKGVIKPLAQGAIPLIEWRMRDVAETKSHVVMTDLHSCANCHSFSRDGKTLGLDMDGPQNDKGLYALVPVDAKMRVRTRDMISWASFSGETDPQSRLGFMSQVSPDGKYVMTTVKPPGTKNWQFYYVANFTDYRFLQVFYPTRGILSWYDREAKKLRPLPGADDPKFVQASAVWSPDGKYLVFARAEAKDPSPVGVKMATYANDPAEVKIQYDLYRIPFNDGRGGVPERIEGASQNGMSNSFAKVSPDGKWIVFVQAHNGQLMRPDGKLYIVPAAGGKARLMNCNTSLMNSWHSFSPNGRWLVFSSKSRTPYTQMFLTHIDEDGNDSPAILIENSTAANRAVNIPEFVNMNRGGIDHIDTPAVDFYRQFDAAADLAKKGQYDAAIAEWDKALAMQPDDASAHNGLGQTLLRAGKVDEAVAQLREAVRLRPHHAEAHNNLGAALLADRKAAEAEAEFKSAIEADPDYAPAHRNLGSFYEAQGRVDESIAEYRKAIEADPQNAPAYVSMGSAMASKGDLDEAMEAYRKAIENDPAFASAHNYLGLALATKGQLDDAIPEYRKAIEYDPRSASAYNNLGLAMASKGDSDGAIGDFAKAAELDPANAGVESNLGHALLAKKRLDEAIPHFRRALELGPETTGDHTSLGIALAKKGQMSEAIPQFERALALSPDDAQAHYYLGKALIVSGQGAAGLKYWRQALDKDPDNLQTLNDTAWVLATSQDDAVRNGKEALPLAEHAMQLSSGQEPAILGTAAAVYAETGNFEQAMALEQRAIELANQQGNAALAQSLAERMELFRGKTPIRQ